ncbi:hypothetical protein QR77_18945 [Streptomyces sp. 150FB]|uniref:lactonase family protein n=1 Tax=Streptomyces sp. 150FB TaxID=1576605 RepID=UPI00058936FE|nr:beta-propeller fold lactonase family protein [Streptomyces sp. 150FB]KIF75414.1 hypothetical protein QR77_18945 [Streptomyces sp. 150FB]
MPSAAHTLRAARTVRAARAIAVGATAIAAAAVFASPASAAAHGQAGHQSPARSAAPVFVQTDNPAGNAVVAYHRAADGTLTKAGSYPTSGLGGILDGSAVDHLASQGSLAYDQAHHLLYAVNAGSDTVTVFAVDGDRLERTQTITSGGKFPVSITVHGNQVYVANALDGGSIQGYLRVGDRLVKVPTWHRALGLDPAAAPQFLNTPGGISFTPDGSALVVTTKANGSSIDVFRLGLLGTPSAKPVVNAEAGAVPFGFTFDARGRLVVTEAGPNAVATYTLARDGKVTQVDQKATGGAATCWVIGAGGKLYASNAGTGTISGYSEDTHGKLTALGDTATDAGTVDVAASSDGRFLYAQTGKSGAVDEFRVNGDGSLTAIGSVTVPGAVGGEGIVAL